MTIAESGMARPKTESPSIRIVHRSASGEVDLDYPLGRLADAIADLESTTWVDIETDDAQAEVSAVESLFREVFAFHPLAIDDALQEAHVPKVDDWGGYLYLVFLSVEVEPELRFVRPREVDIFLSANYLVTYHTRPIAGVDDLRRVLSRDGGGERLKRGPDHVLYLLLDSCVAAYLSTIERLDDQIDAAQEEVFDDPTPGTLQRIFEIRRMALRFHRIISPTREVLNRLARDDYPQIDAPDRVYFRDVYDHLVRIHDISESLRDLISGALDTYLSAISNRTNEVMKTLTFVTVMFLPMTFIVGFFGMNFFAETLAFQSWLPKRLLFAGSCGVMLLTPIALGLWARHRGWF